MKGDDFFWLLIALLLALIALAAFGSHANPIGYLFAGLTLLTIVGVGVRVRRRRKAEKKARGEDDEDDDD